VRFVQERGCLHPRIVRKTPATFARMWASALLFCHFRNSRLANEAVGKWLSQGNGTKSCSTRSSSDAAFGQTTAGVLASSLSHCLARRLRRRDKPPHLRVILLSRRRFHTARHVHGKRPHFADGVGHVLRCQTARKDDWPTELLALDSQVPIEF